MVTHLVCRLDDVGVGDEPSSAVEDRMDRAVSGLAPWCMAQHFATRLAAQACFRKVWARCEALGATAVLSRYAVLKDCIGRSVVVGRGNAERMAGRLAGDFYLATLDVARHYSLVDVLYNLPRLCRVASDEWVGGELLARLGIEDSHIKAGR